MLTTLAVTAFAAVGCAALGTVVMRRRAHAWGLVDIPNDRSMHTRATPRGGGIVLVLVVIAGLAAAVAALPLPTGWTVVYAALALVVAAIGWRDDLRSVAPLRRLLVHVAAAAAATAVWGTFDAVAFPYTAAMAVPPVAAAVLTVVWLVGLLNAYNFMDGIDGIASGQAVAAGVTWVVICGPAAPLPTAVAALIAAASLGFLLHNWAPARIFMGDAGSGFLGFSFALLPLIAYATLGDARLPLAGVLVVAPFVFDTGYTLVRRLARGENVLRAHRTHLYQRLVTAGLSHGVTAALYIGLAAVCGAATVLWMRGAGGGVLLVPLGAVAALPVLTAIVEKRNAA